jgi:hypothetical protein
MLSTVKLRSTDLRDTPLITFNYFDIGVAAHGIDKKDLQASYEAMNFIRTMFNITWSRSMAGSLRSGPARTPPWRPE